MPPLSSTMAMSPLPWLDTLAVLIFAVCWLFYEPTLKRVQRGGAINTDMTVIRQAWMRQMAGREVRLVDSQLMGHAISSATFFVSANLIVIAAVSGALFGGEQVFRSIQSMGIFSPTALWLFEAKIALVMITLVRGLLDFTWAIRQMNYTLAVIGATPDLTNPESRREFGDAASQILNPALSAFSGGVRGYYFALAAAAWLGGPIPFILATVGATGLLFWRQSASQTATGVRRVRRLLEGEE